MEGEGDGVVAALGGELVGHFGMVVSYYILVIINVVV